MSLDLVHRVILMKACASVLFADRRAGVRKEDYAARDYFDVWLPELAPSAPLVSWALSEPFTPNAWPSTGGGIGERCGSRLLSVSSHCWLSLSSRDKFSVGCYCEDETRCHRSLLRELLFEQGAEFV